MSASIAALILALSLLGPDAAHAERVHVVQPGESLWIIAERIAGDASLWPILFRANRDQIGDPSVLHPGQRLTIPPVEGGDGEEVRRDADLRIR